MTRADRASFNGIVADLRRRGWRIVRKNHVKAYCPCGKHIIVMPATVSDPRGLNNAQALVKRTLRECSTSSSSEGEA